MGLDCSLLLLKSNGTVREISLDRAYVFDGIELNIWYSTISLLEKLKLEFNELKVGYCQYWWTYTIACLEQIATEEMQVGIFDENQQLISKLYNIKHFKELPYNTREYLEI
jgi:hypothetical protein